MKAIFITGTAGSGKSLLTSKICEYYERNKAYVSILNLDPGVESLPYICKFDIREYVDTTSIMNRYGLGPNGASIMAIDIMATKFDEIQSNIDKDNPDYLIIDTPGQIELFAYRNCSKFLVKNLNSDEKINIFIYDGAIVTTPSNFISIALLSTSIRLRFNIPTINVLTKFDIIQNKNDVLSWSTDLENLKAQISKETNNERYTLMNSILMSLDANSFIDEIIPISNITNYGINVLESNINMITDRGEEI